MQDFRDPRAALFGIHSVFTKCPDMKRDAEGSESSCSECDIGPRGGKSQSEVLTGATRSARGFTSSLGSVTPCTSATVTP
jgi:hypothetical protein